MTTYDFTHLAEDEKALLKLIWAAGGGASPFRVSENKVVAGSHEGYIHPSIVVSGPSALTNNSLARYISATSPFEIRILLARLDFFRWNVNHPNETTNVICKMREALQRIADGEENPEQIAEWGLRKC